MPDPRANNRLGAINEADEYESWQDDFESRFDLAQRTLGQPGRRSTHGSMHQKALQKENKICPKCQAEKDLEEQKASELSKPEVEQIVKSPDFCTFFDNSSRLVERALGQEFNLIEEFFTEEDENKD